MVLDPSSNIQIPDWNRDRITLGGGFSNAQTPELLPDTKLSGVRNMFLQRGRVRVDTGYVDFLGPVRGLPQGTFQGFFADGSQAHLLVTTETIYVQSGTTWIYVSSITPTTLTSAMAAGDTVANVADSSAYTTGDYIGLPLDNGMQHQTTVAGTGSGTITLTDAIPAGRSVADGSQIVLAVALNGSTSIPIQLIPWPINGYILISNGVDPILYYALGIVHEVPGLPTNTTCRTMAVFHEQLYLADTTENGTNFPYRIRRSDQADITEWSSGLAGIDDQPDTEDFIQLLETLGPYLIVYREQSIMRASYLGLPNQTVFYEYMVVGTGVVSGAAVATPGGSHIIAAHDGIYEYVGGYDITPIGEEVFYQVFSNVGDMSPTYKSQLFMFYVAELDEIWLFYTSTNATSPDTLLRYNIGSKAYFFRYFDDTLLGYGFYQLADSRAWNDLVGSWLDQTWTWNSQQTLADSPITLLCSATQGQVYSYDYVATTDDGATIGYSIASKAFGNPDTLTRLNGMLAFGTGNAILVEYSPDLGVTWLPMGTLNLGTTASRQRITLQAVAEYFMFRFSGEDANTSISWIELESLPETDY